MTRLIIDIKAALADSASVQELLPNLQDSDFIFETEYPIALIHSATRLDAADQRLFQEQELLDENGHTPIQPSTEQLKFLAQNRSQYIKNVNIMCLKEAPAKPIRFLSKRPGDYWKKIQDVEYIASMFEISNFDDQTTLCEAEFDLREIIRKRKEVHALKDVGFIWMAIISKDLKELFTHYFGDNYIQINTGLTNYQLGWSDTLRDISMRDFVCPPG